MIMPSMVRMARILLATSDDIAILKLSLNSTYIFLFTDLPSYCFGFSRLIAETAALSVHVSHALAHLFACLFGAREESIDHMFIFGKAFNNFRLIETADIPVLTMRG